MKPGRAGDLLKQAEAEYRAECNPSLQEIVRFRISYLTRHLQGEMSGCNRAEIRTLLAQIKYLADEWGYTEDGDHDPN